MPLLYFFRAVSATEPITCPVRFQFTSALTCTDFGAERSGAALCRRSRPCGCQATAPPKRSSKSPRTGATSSSEAPRSTAYADKTLPPPARVPELRTAVAEPRPAARESASRAGLTSAGGPCGAEASPLKACKKRCVGIGQAEANTSPMSSGVPVSGGHNNADKSLVITSFIAISEAPASEPSASAARAPPLAGGALEGPPRPLPSEASAIKRSFS
mmetsp:Transcript_88756/g.286825  ORF Transcript_88756/g.286825 Transcript_88756/m.286825 type:complete len:216 (+) Transcript_88756:314-961(+)